MKGYTQTKRFRMAEVEQLLAEIDAVIPAVGQVLARHHEMGQAHWLGGSMTDGTWSTEVLQPRIAAAFNYLYDASAVLGRASHELAMLTLEGDDACTDQPVKKEEA